MRSVQRRVTALERHRHPSSDSEVADLEIRVAALEAEMATVEGQISALEGDVTTLQADIVSLQADIVSVQADISALQGDVATLSSDSGWLLLAGINEDIWLNATRYRKVGHMVTIRFNVQLTGLSSSTASYTYGAGALPVAFRPDTYNQYTMADNTTANDRVRRIQAQPDGLVGFDTGSAVSQNQFLFGTFTYSAG